MVSKKRIEHPSARESYRIFDEIRQIVSQLYVRCIMYKIFMQSFILFINIVKEITKQVK